MSRPYTKKEDEKIATVLRVYNYKDVSHLDKRRLAKELGRTIGAITWRLHQVRAAHGKQMFYIKNGRVVPIIPIIDIDETVDSVIAKAISEITDILYRVADKVAKISQSAESVELANLKAEYRQLTSGIRKLVKED